MEDGKQSSKKKPYVMDPDHRLLLRVTKPLLQSRNTAVRREKYISMTFNLI